MLKKSSISLILPLYITKNLDFFCSFGKGDKSSASKILFLFNSDFLDLYVLTGISPVFCVSIVIALLLLLYMSALSKLAVNFLTYIFFTICKVFNFFAFVGLISKNFRINLIPS